LPQPFTGTVPIFAAKSVKVALSPLAWKGGQRGTVPFLWPPATEIGTVPILQSPFFGQKSAEK
jgi:hypothetical protein